MAESAIFENAAQLKGPVTLNGAASSDVTESMLIMAVNLGLCPRPEDLEKGKTASGADVPPSLAIIEAGATSFSKVARNAIAGIGGLSVALAAVASFWNMQTAGVRAAAFGAIALVMSACLVAFAVVVSSDVRARAEASAAQYAARGRLAEAYLSAAQNGPITVTDEHLRLLMTVASANPHEGSRASR